jgi:nucleoside 2-deoxyribosyltransferase
MPAPATSVPFQAMSGQKTAGRSGDVIRRRIYLAGPFTSHLTSPAGSTGGSNTSRTLPYAEGVIDSRSAWRRTLLATTEALERAGWSVFLPHRDVSRWGERDASPGMVARECLQAVVASDVVVAVMGESFGTHVEVGAALARGIPVVLVRTSTSAESFFALAVAQSPWVGELLVPDLADMPQMVASDAFRAALERASTAHL